MSLLQTIKADQLAARKAKQSEVASLLTTLIGEASMPGKNDGNRESTDAEVMAVIKKFVKNANELIKSAGPSADASVNAQAEIDTLEKYLPKQMSEDELKEAVQKIVDTLEDKSPRAMGVVMKELKANFDGQYDGKAASGIVKAALS